MRKHLFRVLIWFHLLAIPSARAQVDPAPPPDTFRPPEAVPPEAEWSWAWVAAILLAILIAIAIWYAASRRTRP